MKLSLGWLHEYLDSATGSDSILEYADEIVQRLARSTAEIEQVEHVALNLENLFLGTWKPSVRGAAVFEVPELGAGRFVPLVQRSSDIPGAWYMIYREGPDRYRYATLHDLSYAAVGERTRKEHSISKDSVLPIFFITDDEVSGGWKERCETRDVCITIDNKSINHRPDLWSHYGFAREVAVLMDWHLKGRDTHVLSSTSSASVLVDVQSVACNRFARLDLAKVTARGSLPWMALRLIRVEQRPISAIVDCTNYIMFDLGQPLHAFDSDCIQGALTVRQAKKGESLVLLDGHTLELNEEDCVVADQAEALALAGIKGGRRSGVSLQTKAISIEAAHFLPIPIQQSSRRHHIRTESSRRFEKGVDPNHLLQGISKYFNLLVQAQITSPSLYQLTLWEKGILSETCIELWGQQISDKIGSEILASEVKKILYALGFAVCVQEEAHDVCYRVKVPSWRLHDISIPEDLIEELARVRGYNNIRPVLPIRHARLPENNGKVLRARNIRHHVAYGLRMQEVKSYPFFDEEFLRTCQLVVNHVATIRNPVSEQWKRLVTSLIPNLMSLLVTNLPEEKNVRLFEVGTTWLRDGDLIREQKRLSWVWYSAQSVDFYTGKQLVMSLLEMLSLPCSWHKASVAEIPMWWSKPHAAWIKHGSQTVGLAGMIATPLMKCVGEGQCFAVELDFDFMQNYIPERAYYHPVSKYPTITTDISMLLAYSLSVDSVIQAIANFDPAIISVSLIDFFEKKEWHDKRSITLRIICSDSSRTLTHDEVNEIMAKVAIVLQERFKAQLR